MCGWSSGLVTFLPHKHLPLPRHRVFGLLAVIREVEGSDGRCSESGAKIREGPGSSVGEGSVSVGTGDVAVTAVCDHRDPPRARNSQPLLSGRQLHPGPLLPQGRGGGGGGRPRPSRKQHHHLDLTSTPPYSSPSVERRRRVWKYSQTTP